MVGKRDGFIPFQKYLRENECNGIGRNLNSARSIYFPRRYPLRHVRIFINYFTMLYNASLFLLDNSLLSSFPFSLEKKMCFFFFYID